ncbi:hypothetical protein ACFO5O_14000 [Geojedonia litorea]|uniref:CarboxypepD_reg-like domain-containing protein n=1 Tax=Geojedonia litorea TaxID=1268269 RepID=A0ABV9N7I1_9FLAO
MKNVLLCVLFFFVSFSALAQIFERIEVKGKIVVDSSDVEGITIYNTSSNKGTFANEKGEFTIAVMLNDRVEFHALQFKDFTITIDQNIIDSRQMTVFLIEKINRLDEVIILPKGLSGDLVLDIENVKTVNVDMNALYFGIMNSDEYDFTDDYRSQIENIALHSQSQTMVNGLNVVNLVGVLLKPLFKSKKKEQQSNVVPEMTVSKLQSRYDIEFLSSNFGIPKDRVSDFVNYVESSGMDYSLLDEGKELQFLEYLNTKSQHYLKTQIEKN